MCPQFLHRMGVLLLVFGIGGSVLGEQSNPPKILFTYKDKEYTAEDLTGVSERELSTILGNDDPKYDLKKYPRPEGFSWEPALKPWDPTDEVTRRAFYEYQLQAVVEYFIRFEVFKIFKERHSVNVKRYYRADLIEESMRQHAELADRVPSVIISALDEKLSEAEIIARLKKEFPKSYFSKGKEWTKGIRGIGRYRSYRALTGRCFPWLVGGKPAPWVKHLGYSSLIMYHVQAEIERDKPKYIRMLEDRFGRRNYFVIRKAQDSDKKQLLKLIDQVTNRKGDVARGGLEKINETLQKLKSPTRFELWFGDKQNIAFVHKISENRLKPREFISLGKAADGLQSYLYIFQEKPTPHFKEYSSAPGNFLYGTGKDALLRPLVEEVRAALKPAKGIKIRSTDEIVIAIGGSFILIDNVFGVSLPKVLLKD